MTRMVSAREAGLVACNRCELVHEASISHCERCGARLHSRKPFSLQRVWAWWVAGLIAYIPANLYPMLTTQQLGTVHSETIVGGVITLIELGSIGIAAIIFFASVVVPISKFLIIAFLAISVLRPSGMSAHSRLHLHHVIEFIGRWSMIDVFVVALLAALVQLGAAASVEPGPAAACFALSVAFTMLSAQAFDPRLIWDAPVRKEPAT
ncbi:paraquat-inducible protein A [Pontivivens ytuae]|uniref:Paraquat-inducible protein A n=1 Tax=Pontivivens ytuae TaxID=2789856 RepID=A0A7S9QBD5_9RHOB|nr:paraquat-inducible protein A [Pontivivens ytuae]QPH52222.1 paraquat-inducible protein A [Pontivivens ytuae]